MKIKLENVLPSEIEKRSFEIITEELGDRAVQRLSRLHQMKKAYRT